MNYEMMLFVIMNIARVEGALMLLPALVALIYGENTVAGKILIIAVLCICLGSVFSRKRPKRSDIFVKDGLMIVGLAWVMFSLLGALPFYFTGAIPRFVDAFFETVSGFTTVQTSHPVVTHTKYMPLRNYSIYIAFSPVPLRNIVFCQKLPIYPDFVV